MLIIIIIFLGIVFSLAGVLAMGAIPEIFKQGEQLDQALIQQHEYEARANQTLHEDVAREEQAAKINRETNKSINDLENRLYNFMNLSSKRSEIGAQERAMIANEVLNISQQHDRVAKDHNTLQIKMQNMTTEIYNLLKMAAERNYQATLKNTEVLANLTKELREIKSLHKEIMEGLKTLN
jgi:hypothetical protein